MNTLAEAVHQATQRALSQQALIPFEVSGQAVADDTLPWRVEWASSLAKKDQAGIPKPGAKPGAFNPFLPYDPALYVADLGDAHVLLLNKFPVLLNHVLVITRAYADQEQLLQPADLAALARAMSDIEGLAFFNGGVQAGASVQHRHLQIAPFKAPLMEALYPRSQPGEAPQTLAELPFRHAFVRFGRWPDTPEPAGAMLHERYRQALAHCGLQVQADGRLPPYNLLATRQWLLLVPRAREVWQDGDDRISLNAMSFAGSIFVRDPDLMPKVRRAGLMALLRSVTFARD